MVIMAILKADKTTKMNGVTVNEYLLTKHNPNKIDMPTHKITNLISCYYMGWIEPHGMDCKYFKRK